MFKIIRLTSSYSVRFGGASLHNTNNYIKNNLSSLSSTFNNQTQTNKLNQIEQQQQQKPKTTKNNESYLISKNEELNLAKRPTNRVVNPLKHDDFFEIKNLVKLDELFKARCHYGHDAGLRCPWMSEFIFGTRVKTDIINLDLTIEYFTKALNFIAHIAFKKGVILFVTRYAQHIPLIERTAVEAGEYSHCKPWLNGTFTDSMRRFGSVIRLPDLIVFFHAHEKLNEPHGAINEAAKMFIPTVAICDTDIDPSLITYPIPANDDSMTSVQLYARLVKEVILKAKAKRKELELQNVIIDYQSN